MECKKCNLDIPAIYEFSIARNMCPKCGGQLLHEELMKIFLDLKKQLATVQLTLDPTANCEKLAMFLVSNYEIKSISKNLNQQNKLQQVEKREESLQTTVVEPEENIEEYRQRLATEAEEKLAALEFGLSNNLDEDLNDDQMKKIERLRKVAMQGNAMLKKPGASLRRITSGDE